MMSILSLWEDIPEWLISRELKNAMEKNSFQRLYLPIALRIMAYWLFI